MKDTCKCDNLQNGDIIKVNEQGLCIVCGRGTPRMKDTTQWAKWLSHKSNKERWIEEQEELSGE